MFHLFWVFVSCKQQTSPKNISTGFLLMWPHLLSTLSSKSYKNRNTTTSAAISSDPTFYCPSAPYEDECRHVFVDGGGYEGPRRRNTLYDSRRVKRGPGALHIKERISLLINILFLRWKFQVAVIRKRENTQSRNSLRFLRRRICSRVVNLSFMGHARGPTSFCFPTINILISYCF